MLSVTKKIIPPALFNQYYSRLKRLIPSKSSNNFQNNDEIDNFVDHTGFFCQKRWLRILKKRIEKKLSVHDTYKKNLELDKLREIEDGRYEL